MPPLTVPIRVIKSGNLIPSKIRRGIHMQMRMYMEVDSRGFIKYANELLREIYEGKPPDTLEELIRQAQELDMGYGKQGTDVE